MRPASSVAATTAFLTLFSLACSRTQSAAGPPAMPPTPVALAPAKTTAIEDTTEYVATLKSLRSTAVQPQIEGQVTQGHATELWLTPTSKLRCSLSVTQISKMLQHNVPTDVRKANQPTCARWAKVSRWHSNTDTQRCFLFIRKNVKLVKSVLGDRAFINKVLLGFLTSQLKIIGKLTQK